MENLGEAFINMSRNELVFETLLRIEKKLMDRVDTGILSVEIWKDS